MASTTFVDNSSIIYASWLNDVNSAVYNGTITGYNGFKNRIINGAMMIDQRNAGASKSVTASTDTYVLDRWVVYAVGNAIAAQQVASGVTGIPYVQQLTGAASVTTLQTTQRIESKNIADLASSTVTLSAYLSNSLLTTVTWTAYYANATDNFSALTSIATGTFTVNSTLTQYSTQISLPANASNGIAIVLQVGAQTSGTFKIGNVQLEKGTTATSFDYRPYGTEFQLCQRYYEVSPSAVIAYAQSTTAGKVVSTMQVTKRATPTISVISGAFPSAQAIASTFASGLNYTMGTLTITSYNYASTTNTYGFDYTNSNAIAGGTGMIYIFNATVSSPLFSLSAEL